MYLNGDLEIVAMQQQQKAEALLVLSKEYHSSTRNYTIYCDQRVPSNPKQPGITNQNKATFKAETLKENVSETL